MGRIARTAGWEARLTQYLERAHGFSFQWGEMDCAHFALGALRALAGIQCALDIRNAVNSMRRSGNMTQAAYVFARENGLEQIPPLLATRGDPVLAYAPDATLGVSSGPAVLFVKQGVGVYPVPIDSRLLQIAWRIP